MRNLHFWPWGLAGVAAFAVLLATVFGVRLCFRCCARRKSARNHLRRLALDIRGVAQTIEADLAACADSGPGKVLSARCREIRLRVEAAGARVGFWRLSGTPSLKRRLEDMHEEHRRIVDLRSDADAVVAAMRDGEREERSCKFATRSKPQRSRPPGSGSHSSPSTQP
jgi:hypothetical protein